MIKQFGTLSLVLFASFICWSIYERSCWPIDFTTMTAQSIYLDPVDLTFQQHIIPKYFQKAQIITNSTDLKYPQDIAVSNDGTIYSGLSNGDIVKITPQGEITRIAAIADAGLILGIIITSDDSTLYFLCQHLGLMRLDIATLKVTDLLSNLNGKQLMGNNLCLDEINQIIYFTVTGIVPMEFSNVEVLLKGKNGKIMAYHISENKVDIIVDNVAFPNGIAYEISTQSVIYVQQSLHRLMRLYVGGEMKGKQQIIIGNLFGYGDNLKFNEKGELLLAFPATRDPFLQFLNDKPEIRKYLLYIPERMFIAMVKKRAGGVKIDTKSGKIIEYLFGGPVKINFVTTILEKNGKTYFSSIKNPTILVLNNIDKPLQQNTQTINIDL